MVFGKIIKNAVCALLGAVLFAGLTQGAVRAHAASPALGSLSLEKLSEDDRENALEELGFDAPEEEYLAAYKDTAWKKNFTKAELRLVSALIFAEANGMGFDAKVAVGNVVLNRMYDEGKYGYVSTVKEVIYDHKWGYQFSPVIDGSLDKAFKIYDSMDPEKCKDWEIRAMTACKEAAKAALSGWKTVPDDFQYFNSHLEKQSAECMKNGWSFKIIERHIYYSKNTGD